MSWWNAKAVNIIQHCLLKSTVYLNVENCKKKQKKKPPSKTSWQGQRWKASLPSPSPLPETLPSLSDSISNVPFSRKFSLFHHNKLILPSLKYQQHCVSVAFADSNAHQSLHAFTSTRLRHPEDEESQDGPSRTGNQDILTQWNE